MRNIYVGRILDKNDKIFLNLNVNFNNAEFHDPFPLNLLYTLLIQGNSNSFLCDSTAVQSGVNVSIKLHGFQKLRLTNYIPIYSL